MRKRFLTTGYILVLMAAAVPQGGCSRAQPPPNIILITLDTMRSDHLGCYGYARPTSPRIDDFAGRATLYTHARASASWTVPTHASLFTGKFAFEHGAHIFAVDQPTQNNINPLSVRFLTLAEVLQEQGYDTGAFVANAAFLGTHWQLNQGFDSYVVDHVPAIILNRRVFGWLAGRVKPFFLFVNYMDTHGPYNTSKPAPFLAAPAVRDNGELLEQLYERVMPAEAPVPEDLAQKVIDQYDTAIANLDEQVGVLIDRLKEMGLYENSLIVVTSDHGEFFGEHHIVKHCSDIYEEVLRVPLIIKGPKQREPRRVDALTTSPDVPGLMLAQVSFDTQSPLLKKFTDGPGDRAVIAENNYALPRELFNPKWGNRFNRVRTAVYDWPYKFILSSDERHELYNLERDPSESDNLFDDRGHVEVARRLQARLLQFQSTRRRADDLVEQDPLAEEQLKKLKAVGYIGN